MKVWRYYCVLLIMFLCSFHIYAATLHITAEYNPAAYEAGGAQFINTTPCLQWPEATSNFWCKGTPTIDTPQAVYFTIAMSRWISDSKKMSSLHYIKYPGPRSVVLTKKGGDKKYNISFITTAVGSQMDLDNPERVPISENGNCFDSKTYSNNRSLFVFRDIRSVGIGGECYGSNPLYEKKYLKVSAIYLGYKLKAPNPYEMENGTYTGTLVLSIGNRGDFNFGTGTPETQLTITFEIKVHHQIKVSFTAASGEHTVSLQPPGGWDEWVNRAPPFLKAVTPYQIWFSSKINISRVCEHGFGPFCLIKNIRDGDLVLVEVSVDDLAGKKLLLTDKPAELPPPRSPSSAGEIHVLNFMVINHNSLEAMMKRPGALYTGYVTVIFDASI